jgi:hypothetical protein
MSRTFNTRPGWVREFYDGVLDHDHTGGQCRVETLADARLAARRHLGSHFNRCGRVVWVPADCNYFCSPKCTTAHTRASYDPALDCGGCDTAPEHVFTCEHKFNRGFVYEQKAYGARIGPEFLRDIYHSPMRRTARDVLRRAAGEYNAGYRPGGIACDDLEDAWEPEILPDNNATRLRW